MKGTKKVIMDKSQPTKDSIGGLLANLKPNHEIKIKDTDYVVRNVGLHTVRLHIYINPGDKADNSKMEGRNKEA